jgi:hypothetical protein
MNAHAKIEPSDEFAVAFVKLQSEIRPAIKDATNPAFRSKYADLGAVWEAVKDPLHANGFSVIQSPDFDGTDMWLTTTILHTSGQSMAGRYPIRPVKQDPQGFGSAITYARRYSISAMLGVIADEDDDGNAASGNKSNGNGNHAPTGKVTADQVKMLRELIDKVNANIEQFCTYFKIEALPDLPGAKYATAIEILNTKGARK